MVVGARTFTGDVLARLGLDNVFGAGPDRYPHVAAGQIRAAAPDLILLPDEPYRFTPEDGPRSSPPTASSSSRAACSPGTVPRSPPPAPTCSVLSGNGAIRIR